MSLTDIANISISKIPKSSELYSLDEPIEIESPFMRVAFVERDRYGQMFIKVEFTDVGSNKSMNKFYTIIHTIERIFYRKLCYMLNLSLEDCRLSSQIYKNPKKTYDPILTIKIPKKKGKKYIDATIRNSKRRTFYDIQQHDFVKVKIFAKCLWTNSNKFTMKWNISELEFREPDSDDEAEATENPIHPQQHPQQHPQHPQQHPQQQLPEKVRVHKEPQQLPERRNNQRGGQRGEQRGESKYNHRTYRRSEPQRGGGYRGFSGGNFKDTNGKY
jgi:hypothetical protein